MPDYIDVAWIHDSDCDPVRLVCELDHERMETRKLEFFADGRVEFVSEDFASSEEIGLGYVETPALEEINSDPQFRGITISAAEFEELWTAHVRANGR